MTTYREYVGQPLNISGRVEANPSPTVQWSRDGTVLNNSTRVQLFPAAVIFSSVQENDNGTYVVSATNSQGSANFTCSLIAICELAIACFIYPLLFHCCYIFHADLQFVKGQNVTVIVNLSPNEDVSLSCEVKASNPPLDLVTLEFPNGTVINITESHHESVRLTPAMRRSGAYTCTATNSDISTTLTYQINPPEGTH